MLRKIKYNVETTFIRELSIFRNIHSLTHWHIGISTLVFQKKLSNVIMCVRSDTDHNSQRRTEQTDFVILMAKDSTHVSRNTVYGKWKISASVYLFKSEITTTNIYWYYVIS